MKNYIAILIFVLSLSAFSQVPPPPAATQTEVNAGTIGNKYVSPKTLAGNLGTNGINAATATNAGASFSYVIKSVGSWNDHLTTFTNLQECFNTISNSSMSYIPITTNSGLVFTEPQANYSIHFDANASCYVPQGFKLYVNRTCTFQIAGDYGSRIIGDSNVFQTFGMSSGANNTMKSEISGITFICNNPYAKTMMIYAYGETMYFHDNILVSFQILTNKNILNSSGIYGLGSVYTNPPGIIGFVGFGEHNLQTIERNYFVGLAVPIIAAYPHWTIKYNEFAGTSTYDPISGGSAIFSNAWSSLDEGFITSPDGSIITDIKGWECALGVDIVADPYSGDFTVTGNHLVGGIYLDDRSSPSLGAIAIYYNSFETGAAQNQNLIVSSNFVTNPREDYWGNEKGFGSFRKNQNLNIFIHTDMFSYSNLYLSGFTNPAGLLDTTINGVFKIKTTSAPINAAANFNSVIAVYTNVANTDAMIFLNPPDGDSGNGYLYISNTISGKYSFAAAAGSSILDGLTANFPMIPDDSFGFFKDNATGSAAPGSYTLLTNNFLIQPQYTVTNIQVMDGLSRIMSNGVIYYLNSSGWTNGISPILISAGNLGVTVINTAPLNPTNLTAGTTLPALNAANLTNMPLSIKTVTSNQTIPSSTVSMWYNNSGAGGAVTNTLPTATAGLQYGLDIETAQPFAFDAEGTDTIRDANSVSAAGGYLFSSTIGNTIHIHCEVAGKWVTDSAVGTWTTQ